MVFKSQNTIKSNFIRQCMMVKQWNIWWKQIDSYDNWNDLKEKYQGNI